MERKTDPIPAGVPQATQAGSIHDRWPWTETSVWTERMMKAVEKGVQGGAWFSLIDKVYASVSLGAAWAKVQANRGAAGIDKESIAMFARQRSWRWPRSPTLAERLLYTAGPFLPGACPYRGASVPVGTTNRRAGCGKSASPVRREGERANPLSLPLFFFDVTHY